MCASTRKAQERNRASTYLIIPTIEHVPKLHYDGVFARPYYPAIAHHHNARQLQRAHSLGHVSMQVADCNNRCTVSAIAACQQQEQYTFSEDTHSL